MSAAIKPTKLSDLHYKFNEQGELRHVQTNDRLKVEAENEELINNLLIKELQLQLIQDFKFIPILLPKEDHNNDILKGDTEQFLQSHSTTSDHVPIFISSDFFHNKSGCVIVIPGSGIIQPPLLSLSITINDNISNGCMFDYIKQVQKLGFSMILLNTNKNTYLVNKTAETKQEVTDIPQNEDSDAHCTYVYRQIILRHCPAERLIIIADSAGSKNTINLLRENANLLDKLLCSIFIDGLVSLKPTDNKKIEQFLCEHGALFIASEKPLNTPVDRQAPSGIFGLKQPKFALQVSAGHSKHSYTPSSSISAVFQFIQNQMNASNLSS